MFLPDLTTISSNQTLFCLTFAACSLMFRNLLFLEVASIRVLVGQVSVDGWGLEAGRYALDVYQPSGTAEDHHRT